MRDRIKGMFVVQEASCESHKPANAAHTAIPLSSRSGARPRMPSGSTGKTTVTRGVPRLFDEGGRLTEGLTEMILARLVDRKNLELNELNLMIGLLKVYSSACAQSLPERIISKEVEDLQMKCFNLQDRKKLSPAQERLLGQLAIIGFRNSENNCIAVANFPGNRPVRMAKLPGIYKQCDEGKNKRIHKSRVESARRWLDHLPGSFNDAVISAMFLEIDDDVATKTVKEYYSTKL